MKETENCLSINSWYSDIQKSHILFKIPESERTLEMCFVAIRYWGAALQWVPEKYKTYDFCLDAVRHNTPVDEGCSALAFVPEKHKTYQLCLEAIRHDYLPWTFWDCGYTVQFDYAAAINFVPEKLRTPELCFETLIHYPSSPPGYFNFIDNEEYIPKSIEDILNSSELILKALKQMGMPDKYNEKALKYFKSVASLSGMLNGNGSAGF